MTVRSSAPSVRRGATLISIVGAAILALSACAPASGPVHHTVAPHHGGSGSPSSTPTAAALAPPKVRIPLTCDQLDSSSLLNSVLGTTMTPVNNFPDPSLFDYMAIQDGALNCSWAGPSVGGNPVADFSVEAMPDAASTWNTYLSQLQDPYPVSYLGPNAHGYCNPATPSFTSESCNLDILVGSVWLEIYADTSEHASTTATIAQVEAAFKPLLAAPIAAIKGVTVTEPAWSDPAATPVNLPTPIDQGAVNEAPIAAAIGAPYAIEVSQPQFDLAGGEIAEMLPVNYRQDGGGGSGAGDTVTPAKDFGLTIEILPSGSWAFAQMEAAASSKPGYATISGLGTKAFMFTGNADPTYKDDTSLVGIVGEHLYSVDVSDPGTPGTPNTVTMAKAAAAYIVTELTP